MDKGQSWIDWKILSLNYVTTEKLILSLLLNYSAKMKNVWVDQEWLFVREKVMSSIPFCKLKQLPGFRNNQFQVYVCTCYISWACFGRAEPPLALNMNVTNLIPI